MLRVPETPRKMRDTEDLVRAALSAAKRAAEHIRAARAHVPAVWDLKGPRDFVTVVDREAERLIAETLRQAYPDAVIVGEELSPDAVHAVNALAFIVDPLDGTANFLHGYPWYAVSIAASVDGELAAGLVLDVPRDLVYHAVRGGGAWHDGRRLAVSTIRDTAVAMIGTGFPFRTPDLFPRYLRQFAAVSRGAASVRRAGSAALDLVDVALGRFDGFWELQLAPWDVAAGTLIVREAGGRVSDVDGSPDVVKHGAIVAGNPAIHEWLLRLLAEEG